MITLKEIREINKIFREIDESHLYPIRGKFNATNRAINRARRFSKVNGAFSSTFEYKCFIEYEINRIVNDPKNF
jgi:hypothetical protein